MSGRQRPKQLPIFTNPGNFWKKQDFPVIGFFPIYWDFQFLEEFPGYTIPSFWKLFQYMGIPVFYISSSFWDFQFYPYLPINWDYQNFTFLPIAGKRLMLSLNVCCRDSERVYCYHLIGFDIMTKM